MHRIAFLFTIALLAACGSKSPAPANPDNGGGGGDEPAAAEVITLMELQNGDRACYVIGQREDGSEVNMEGSFDLCEGGSLDASGLIGQRVTFTTEKANVLAAECEGDMDCGKSDEVDLVTTITAAP